MTGKEKLMLILRRRDGLTEEEAENVFSEAKERVLNAILGITHEDPEDAFMDEMGLEMDYIDMMLFPDMAVQ